MSNSASIPGSTQTNAGWQSVVSSMREAISINPRELLIIALVLGLVLLFVINMRITRRVEHRLDARAEQLRLSHPAREGRRTG
jgi:hypothetical protein